MAYTSRKTIALDDRKFVNTAQKIQRDYYNKIREFLATASDEQIEKFVVAVGEADTMARFAAEQEQEARKEKYLGFTVFEKIEETDEHDHMDDEIPIPACCN